MPVVTKETLSRIEMPVVTKETLSRIEMPVEQGKGRAEEEAEQPRGNSSSRHEMQNPASNELIFSYTANPFGFAIKRRFHGEVMFNSSYGSLVFSIRCARMY
ncbi:hypothetical protein SUGI_0914680 [Cryptomeria japonica]|nr:hypothetical protein SUGI_0914680 [Cryptomeria japonica]